MVPFSSSSGDPLADKRADYAEMLFQSGDLAAAADLMLQAVEQAPGWAYGWFRLGEMNEAAGLKPAAKKAWAMALDVDPADHLGAALKLELLGDGGDLETMPPAFVETLFDQYAPMFEASLVDRLDYQAPALLLDAILATGRKRFEHAIDLGCGTGLMGEALRPHVGQLDGYDISTGMLAVAEDKGVYDHLAQADLSEFVMPEPVADLVAAADVYMYLGALETPLANAATMLKSGGLFAFSVEQLGGLDDFRLRETRRFAHGRLYVQQALKAAGFELVSMESKTIRRDRDAPVVGLIVVATKS